MKIEDDDEITIDISGATEITINWGDGASESKTYDTNDMYKDNGQPVYHLYKHTYSTKSAYTVTVTGNNITYLDCGYNNLTDLDVSRNTALTHLNCCGNQLTHLDVSKNTALKYLYCCFNQLTDLNVSRNTALSYLSCSSNQLTHLDVSRNTALKILDCGYNQFSAAALNALFKTLHGNKRLYHCIKITGNSGIDACNRKIAQKKGWRVFNLNKPEE
jgi:Leucine-rich repeat (LRR) protein